MEGDKPSTHTRNSTSDSDSVPSWNLRSVPYRTFIRPIQLTKIEILSRIGALIFSLVAFSVIAGDSQTGSVEINFTHFKAFNYVFAVDLLVFVYSALHCIMIGVAFIKSCDYEPGFKLLLITFISDQILTLLLFSASSSGATVSEMARNGIANACAPICSSLHVTSFCTQAEAAIFMSFLATLCLVSSTIFSGYHLAWQL